MNQDTLTNPLPEDFSESRSDDQESTGGIADGQLHLELTNTSKPKQLVSGIKMSVKKRTEILEISMLWRSASLPFAITSMISIILILIIGGIIKFSEMQPRIPFFYNSIDKKWEQIDKSIVFIFPAILLIIEGIIIKFAIDIFRSDRRLTIIVGWIITLLNFLILIIISQIYSLIT